MNARRCPVSEVPIFSSPYSELVQNLPLHKVVPVSSCRYYASACFENFQNYSREVDMPDGARKASLPLVIFVLNRMATVRPGVRPGRGVFARWRLSLPASLDQFVALQGVLPGKALLAIVAGERLHGEMNAFVSLEVMVSVERLRANVAPERPVVLRLRRSIQVSHVVRGVPRWYMA